jgi:hypothetical protein
MTPEQLAQTLEDIRHNYSQMASAANSYPPQNPRDQQLVESMLNTMGMLSDLIKHVQKLTPQ